MAPSAVSPAQQHVKLAVTAKQAKDVVDDTTTGPAPGLTKPLTDMMGNWDNFSFAPIRESTVSRAMTSRCMFPLFFHT